MVAKHVVGRAIELLKLIDNTLHGPQRLILWAEPVDYVAKVDGKFDIALPVPCADSPLEDTDAVPVVPWDAKERTAIRDVGVLDISNDAKLK
jgi:hypothetical protein